MNIQLSDIGKRYRNDWIFRNINLQLTSEQHCVVLGANGSGKSTLLQIIAGNIIPTQGTVNYDSVEPEAVFKHVSMATPYLEIPEDFTIKEAVNFQSKFKPFRKNITQADIVSIIDIKNSGTKRIKEFSSGMKQRVKLALAILANSNLLLLDEPCTNLDQSGVDWYLNLIAEHQQNRLIVVCSNHQKQEYSFCAQQFSLENQPSPMNNTLA